MSAIKKLKKYQVKSKDSSHKTKTYSQQEVEQLLNELDINHAQIEAQNHALQETLDELELSRFRYADLYDYAPVGYFTLDCNGCIQEINLTAASLFGRLPEYLLGLPLINLIAKSYHKIFLNHIQKCRSINEKVVTELALNNKEGKSGMYVQLISNCVENKIGTPTNFRTIITDVSERKLLEKEISRFERLNLIGQMMASIAHEIRNPMTTVRGFLQLFREKAVQLDAREQLDLMIEELDRANSIITEFLSLAKRKNVDMQHRDLNDIIEGIYPLLKANALLADCEITLNLGNITDVVADLNEIRQVILNLVRNGLQAMPTGGILTIRTFMQNKDVILAIQDQGTGIPKEILDKLGTPFVTTKEEGTGLGLAVCYSIASRHKAQIKIETSPTGTTFYLIFSEDID